MELNLDPTFLGRLHFSPDDSGCHLAEEGGAKPGLGQGVC